jgi:SAM-dependent methyltransferase
VAEHYRRWPFPAVEHRSREGLILLRTVGRWLKAVRDAPRVVDVGCGTGHTLIALARQFPDVEFTGIDVVEEAVRAAGSRVADEGLRNVRLVRADLTRPVEDVGRFDVVLCLGVLHHLPDLRQGFQHASSLLRQGGHIVLWLYGRYGRERHRLNQELLRLLGADLPDGERLGLARAFLEDLGASHMLDTGFYTPYGSGSEGLAWMQEHPEWLADQMIPPVEESVTLSEILALLEDGDLELERWLGVDLDPQAHTSQPLLLERMRRLPDVRRLLAIDLLLKPAYYFVTGARRDRTG